MAISKGGYLVLDFTSKVLKLGIEEVFEKGFRVVNRLEEIQKPILFKAILDKSTFGQSKNVMISAFLPFVYDSSIEYWTTVIEFTVDEVVGKYLVTIMPQGGESTRVSISKLL